MQLLAEPEKAKKKYLTSVLFGTETKKNFYRSVWPSWKAYAANYGFGVAVFEEQDFPAKLVESTKATWFKLLLPDAMSSLGLTDNEICYLDADIIISPLARDIFEYHRSSQISVARGFRSNSHQSESDIRRIISYLRNVCVDEEFPLDSLVLLSPGEVHNRQYLSGAEPFNAGVLVFSQDEFSNLFLSIFERYNFYAESYTDGGDNPALIEEFHKIGTLNWMPYEFNAQWLLEIGAYHPDLYTRLSPVAIISAIRSALFRADFLHFSGSYVEGSMYCHWNSFEQEKLTALVSGLDLYMRKRINAKSYGRRRYSV